MSDILHTQESTPSSKEPFTLRDFESRMQIDDLPQQPIRRRMTSPSRHTFRHRTTSSLSELDAKDLKNLLHGRSLSPSPLNISEEKPGARKGNLFVRPYSPYRDLPRSCDLYGGNEFDFVDLQGGSLSVPKDLTARNPFALTDSLLDSDKFVDNSVSISWRDLVQNRHRPDSTKTKRTRRERRSTPSSMDIDSNEDSSGQDDKDPSIRRNHPTTRRIFSRKTARPDTTANIFTSDAKKEDDADYSMLYY
ncbi:hypothetical protein INT44_001227 [Umbelopsis vinacea]|uniref:Uncharacterized protein n=1 Tax=Umbelopsis vinacea TaxID=44442 RepID=A0A8H7Q8Q9_9FUNG|nr:hypothetical protein INT44_001227 [Umbelopsis vinacea]